MNYKIVINGKKYSSKDQFISGKRIKQIGKIIINGSVWFKTKNSNQAIEIGDNDTLDLSCE